MSVWYLFSFCMYEELFLRYEKRLTNVYFCNLLRMRRLFCVFFVYNLQLIVEVVRTRFLFGSKNALKSKNGWYMLNLYFVSVCCNFESLNILCLFFEKLYFQHFQTRWTTKNIDHHCNTATNKAHWYSNAYVISVMIPI